MVNGNWNDHERKKIGGGGHGEFPNSYIFRKTCVLCSYGCSELFFTREG